jgi:hypothetical protein
MGKISKTMFDVQKLVRNEVLPLFLVFAMQLLPPAWT